MLADHQLLLLDPAAVLHRLPLAVPAVEVVVAAAAAALPFQKVEIAVLPLQQSVLPLHVLVVLVVAKEYNLFDCKVS